MRWLARWASALSAGAALAACLEGYEMSIAEGAMSQALSRALATVAEAYHPTGVAGPSRDRLAAIARGLGELAAQVSRELQPVLRYHQARVLAMNGNAAEAVAILDQMLTEKDIPPEAIWLNIQLSAGNTDDASNRRRWALEDRLGTAIPLSTWGRLRDGRLEEREAERLGRPLVDSPHRPTLPVVDRDRLLRIADAFAAMKMNLEAANAYREAVYAGFNPPGFPGFGVESWMSEATARTWLTVARLDAERPSLAMHALFLAVSASRALAEPAQLLLSQVLARSLPPVRRELDGAGLVGIARLYAECRLHPRALRVLEVAARLPDVEVEPLRTQIATEWGSLLAAYTRGHEGTSVLFGQKVEGATGANLIPTWLP